MTGPPSSGICGYPSTRHNARLALDPDNDVARKALALREGRLKDLVKTQ